MKIFGAFGHGMVMWVRAIAHARLPRVSSPSAAMAMRADWMRVGADLRHVMRLLEESRHGR